MTEAYRELETRFRRIAALEEIGEVLHWDYATMMPAGGAEARGEQFATLERLGHELMTDPALADLLSAAEANAAALDDWQAANLREMRRRWRHATAVPADLLEARTKAALRSEMLWREARPKSDFQRVQPAFEELLQRVREVAEAKADALDCTPYDALLDQFEPGGRAETIDAVFAELSAFLPDLIARVTSHQKTAPPPTPLPGPFPAEKQAALARRIMEAAGFDFARGRLDVSEHPFSGGVPEDIRITTRWDETDFLSGTMAVLHETGHALYEANLPKPWRLQPVGLARGMTLHESQSLTVEMLAGRSIDFLHYLAPLAQEVFGGEAAAYSPDNLRAHLQRVEPGHIRVEADEVTYPAHVILRYRLERALIAGDLPVADLPGAWNEGMRDLLAIAPPEDRLGVLQDIHWFDGAYGYFPTYTLGALAAAQIFRAALDQRPEIPEALRRGDFAPLIGWLAEAVHARASSRETEEILRAATGRPLSAEAFREHVEARYLGH